MQSPHHAAPSMHQPNECTRETLICLIASPRAQSWTRGPNPFVSFLSASARSTPLTLVHWMTSPLSPLAGGSPSNSTAGRMDGSSCGRLYGRPRSSKYGNPGGPIPPASEVVRRPGGGSPRGGCVCAMPPAAPKGVGGNPVTALAPAGGGGAGGGVPSCCTPCGSPKCAANMRGCCGFTSCR